MKHSEADIDEVILHQALVALGVAKCLLYPFPHYFFEFCLLESIELKFARGFFRRKEFSLF